MDEPEAEDTNEETGVTDDEFSEYLAQEVTDDEGAAIDAEEEVDAEEDAAAADDELDAEFDDVLAADEPENKPEEDTVDMVEIGDGENDTEYDDDNFYDDEISVGDETPEEEIPSDEDIITPSENGDEDIYTEEPEKDEDDYTVVDAETGEEGAEATDLFGGDTENPIEDKYIPDTELYNPHIETSEFNIVDVMFDENVRTGEIMKSGEVTLLRPMIDVDGKKYTEPFKVSFYLNSEGKPVVETEQAMSTGMYNAIISAISSHPKFQTVIDNGIDVDGTVANPEPLDLAGQETDEPASEDNDADVDVDDDILTDEVDADVPADEEDENTGDEDDDIFSDFDFGTDSDPVETYTDTDGTEMEVPAPAADEETEDDGIETPEKKDDDESLIPESKKTLTARQVNENRRSILGIRGKKAGKRPF